MQFRQYAANPLTTDFRRNAQSENPAKRLEVDGSVRGAA